MKSYNFLLSHFFRYILVVIFGILFNQSGAKAEENNLESPVSNTVIHESKEHFKFPDEYSPKGLKVIQITTNPNIISHHRYPEVHMFTPDSKKFVFHRMGVDTTSPGNYWLCDIEDNFGLRQLTDERGLRGMAVSDDGKWMYYSCSSPEGGVQIKRVSLKDFTRETLFTFEGKIPGTEYIPTRYSLRSMSSDGKRLCFQTFLGDGKTENAPYGIFIFDVQ